MQFRSTAKSRNHVDAIVRNSLLASLSLSVLFLLVGCGGSASSASLPQNQNQPAPPAQPAGGDTASSGSSTPSSNSSIPATAKTVSAIQTLPDWQWCTAKLHGKPCASGLGNATSTLTPDQQDPSMSGNSSQFTLGGHTHYSNALWWKSFGANSTATHFVYDLYFYMKHPEFPEALEFDINQSMGGARYTWGTECSYRDSGKWDIWNPKTEAWETTDVPCPVVEANTWHHLIWQVERVNGKVHYISVTLDDQVMSVDKYYDPQERWRGEDVSVAFQLDGDYRQDPYSVWLDNVSLSSW